MLKSVYFMRRTSLIWCFISTLCHVLFLVMYNIEIVYFFPLLWSIACLAFTLNFVRNRSTIYQDCFAIYQFIKHFQCKKVFCPYLENNNKTRDHLDLNGNWNSAGNPESPSSDDEQEGPKPNQTCPETPQTDTLSIINHVESTIKSSEITTTNTMTKGTKKRGDNNNNNNNIYNNNVCDLNIGANIDIDVYEDDDEMIYCGYDDPISEMKLNRDKERFNNLAFNNSPFNVKKRRSNSKTQIDSYMARFDKRNSNTNIELQSSKNIAEISSMSEPMTNISQLIQKTNNNNKRRHQLMPTPIDFNISQLLTTNSINSSNDISIGITDDEDDHNDDTVYDDTIYDEKQEQQDSIQSLL